MSSHKSNSKNGDPVLLIKTSFFWLLNYFLSSFAKNEQDELGLKLESVGAILSSSFNDMLAKVTKSHYGWSSMIKFVLWLLHPSTGTFRVWIKVLSNDCSTELVTKTQQLI